MYMSIQKMKKMRINVSDMQRYTFSLCNTFFSFFRTVYAIIIILTLDMDTFTADLRRCAKWAA